MDKSTHGLRAVYARFKHAFVAPTAILETQTFSTGDLGRDWMYKKRANPFCAFWTLEPESSTAERGTRRRQFDRYVAELDFCGNDRFSQLFLCFPQVGGYGYPLTLLYEVLFS